MSWFYILALVCAILGCIHEISALKYMRSRTYPETEISWEQPPLSLWRYETINMVAITIHTLGLFSLAMLLLTSLTRNRLLTLLPDLGFISSLALLSIAIFGIAMTTFISAVAISYQLVHSWIKPVSYGISSDGKFYGGYLISWNSFSHYEIGPDDGLISLYSSYSPTIRTSVMKPPPELFSGVLGIIQKHLPSAPSTEYTISWQHSPLTLNIGMALLILSTLLPTVWGLIQYQSLVWIYALIAFFLVQVLGIKLLTVFDGRGKYPMKQVPTKQMPNHSTKI